MTDQTFADPASSVEETPGIPEQTKARLRHILSGGQRHSAGAVQLIGLGTLRDRLGNRWDIVKERIYEQTERLFDRHLPPQMSGCGPTTRIIWLFSRRSTGRPPN